MARGSEAYLTMRISPQLKAALKEAAELEYRSLSGMADKILREWLEGRGKDAGEAGRRLRWSEAKFD